MIKQVEDLVDNVSAGGGIPAAPEIGVTIKAMAREAGFVRGRRGGFRGEARRKVRFRERGGRAGFARFEGGRRGEEGEGNEVS